MQHGRAYYLGLLLCKSQIEKLFVVRCGPCKMIAPHLEEMDKTMEDVVFLKVDVDECEDIAAEYNVSFEA